MPRPVHPPLAEGLQIMTVGQKIKALAISAEITFPHPYAPACTARNVGLIAPTELRSVPPQLPRLRPDARLLRAAIIPPTALTRPLSLHAAADNDLRGVVLVPVDGQLPGLLFLLRQLGPRSLVAFGLRAAGAGVGGGSAGARAPIHLTFDPAATLPGPLFLCQHGPRGLVVFGGEGARAGRITEGLRGRGALTVSPAWFPGAGAGLLGAHTWVLGGGVVLRGTGATPAARATLHFAFAVSGRVAHPSLEYPGAVDLQEHNFSLRTPVGRRAAVRGGWPGLLGADTRVLGSGVVLLMVSAAEFQHTVDLDDLRVVSGVCGGFFPLCLRLRPRGVKGNAGLFWCGCVQDLLLLRPFQHGRHLHVPAH
mmetsp:Transcript_5952/g.12757  ORF Transcript_5952/g.12757 Transcript_5952/m.12757 type:complete len:366 (+) Transcript_5952:208-1305(+)